LVILFDAIQFVETALVFSSFLFCTIMFVRTNDRLTLRTLMVLAPVAVLLFISYMYSLHNSDLNTGGVNLDWLSPLFALLVIVLVMASIFTTCHYIIKLYPLTAGRRRVALAIAALLVGAFLIITAVLVMYISKSDLASAMTNALWAFYPLCSLAQFLEAVVLCFMYKNITDPRDQKLARYFLIAFLPQIVYSFIDFFLLRRVLFQITHFSYALFSVFVFVDLCTHFFRHYSRELDISYAKELLQAKYMLSDREIEVVELLVQGLTNQNISYQLHISVNTVKSHVKRIYKKLGVSNRLQLINLLGGNGNHTETAYEKAIHPKG